MEEQKDIPQGKERRKLISGLGILSVVALVSGFRFFKKKPEVIACNPNSHEKRTVKMLTEDGLLVEIGANLIASNSKKITDKELQSLIKK